ncbi:MAG: LacI family DNA-binding transcriptional regulator [Chloroflexota bacterium]
MSTEPRPKRATLYDVAEQSGVSYQTVSRVINESPHVSSNTRRRVLQAIRDLDYQPNKAAQALVTRRSSMLELITFGAAYYGPTQMMISVERAAKALGYRLMFSNIEDANLDEVQNVLDSLSSRLVDGLIIITPVRRPIYDDLTQASQNVPFIQIGVQVGATTPSVVIDQHYGSQLATQHLIDLGHREIAEISGPLYWHDTIDWYDAMARHESWLATLAANQLAPKASVTGDWSAASGYSAAQSLLHNGLTFSALVVANDQMALGAMRAFREHGLSVPGDVSIVGFDDIPEAAYFEPPLTTVRQDFEALGKHSVEYLVEKIKNPEMPSYQQVLYPIFVERQSTRALR